MTQVAEPGSARTESQTPSRISHWIGGRPVAGTSGREGPVFDPATGQVTKHVDFASVAEVGAAVAEAKSAFPAWRATSISKRKRSCSGSGTWSRPTARSSQRS